MLPDGSVVELGGPTGDAPGYDLTGLFVGSEGTFGICTRVTVRLTRNPAALPHAARNLRDGGRRHAGDQPHHRRGIIPAALEMMDQGIVGAVEAAFHFGFPLDAGAVLLIEVDGLEVAVDEEAEKIVAICQTSGAREVRRATTEKERLLLWKCRKQAFGAIGRLESQLLHARRRRPAYAASRDPRVHHRVSARDTAFAS